ncbi:conserved hypothetical protein [Talaromyces stipitatus ATCC 10500]|uniref:Peptidase C14 caspase domain-containing protein n=1 Tax=Talaromyces stipitatus (strain ATCC 10500 / CBS 375.48 / QM 6759 / NRRL 1006) TaxID=441959 RepID=B8LXX9_TALSN|nr:uncharacterized protein TSTA_062810 [Talaromyces stipitatus ATCC 10500]EED22794.1 conserved hypothetical protein [Talaromyces stipitatus ATCC 10500]
MPRRKALIIGINYYGSEHALKGCINDAYNIRQFLVEERGFSPDQRDMVMLTDEPKNEGTPFYPTGQNLIAAFKWLVSYNNPGDSVWLSYSGHGGQVADDYGDRESGFNDTICPVDFETNGQITSSTLHKLIISPMNPYARLTILFDCCHSGSAVELPYTYRPDADGNINLVNNLKEGVHLAMEASNLLQGGFSMDRLDDARSFVAEAATFFHSLHHQPEEADEQGLVDEGFHENWRNEAKDAWMFSGCADGQTSADTSIRGRATGAMSWAFMNVMRENPQQSYLDVLANTRYLIQQHYSQIPQLSVGGEYDLSQPVSF